MSKDAVLVGAIERIKTGWTKRAGARDVDGEAVVPSSDRAICWCLMGALNSNGFDPLLVSHATTSVSLAIKDVTGKARGIIEFNDVVAGNPDDVIKVLERARTIHETY